MAEWDDIINNCLTMGRGRWLCYAANMERRQRESEDPERRPGVRPLVGRGFRPKPPRFLQWERLKEENFQRTMQRGRSRPTFMQGHSYKFAMPMCPFTCHATQHLGLVSLGMWILMPLFAQE